MKAFEVTDGFNRIVCDSHADVELVVSEMRFAEWASGNGRKIDIQEIDIDSIPTNDRWYTDWLRGDRVRSPVAAPGARERTGDE